MTIATIWGMSGHVFSMFRAAFAALQRPFWMSRRWWLRRKIATGAESFREYRGQRVLGK